MGLLARFCPPPFSEPRAVLARISTDLDCSQRTIRRLRRYGCAASSKLDFPLIIGSARREVRHLATRAADSDRRGLKTSLSRSTILPLPFIDTSNTNSTTRPSSKSMSDTNLDLNLIPTSLAMEDTRNVSRAAEQLGVSQPRREHGARPAARIFRRPACSCARQRRHGAHAARASAAFACARATRFCPNLRAACSTRRS